MTVRVVGPRDPRVPGCVNTTSNSVNWSKGLSPFYLGPIPLYDGAVRAVSQTMESAWQFSKCYPCHVGEDGLPTPDYYKWAAVGWDVKRAVRYPMGKGAKPSYCWWGGEKLPYLEARKRVYIPLSTQNPLSRPRRLTSYSASIARRDRSPCGTSTGMTISYKVRH